jgi:TPR repeat protein
VPSHEEKHTVPQSTRDRVFISYSHKDRDWLEKLQIVLKPLIRKGIISIWDDTQIQAGDQWRNQIAEALGNARVAVLLVSPDFLASDFIADHELPPMLRAAQDQGLRILWVLIRDCLFSETEIADYQAAHDLIRPLAMLTSAEVDTALVGIAKKIKAAFAAQREPSEIIVKVHQDTHAGNTIDAKDATALLLLKKAADAGDTIAMINLGWLYENALDVAQDYGTAHGWYQKAAAAGNTNAMCFLGSLYHDGWGIAEDYHKAREWYQKAAASGNANGMYGLGWLYQNGHGVFQDFAKAREWYQKAAAAGNANGMYGLGWLYQNGHGVRQDFGKAREWYEKAAAAGNAYAMDALGRLYEYGYGVAQDFGKARDWYEKAAAAGIGTSMYSLGYFYEEGLGVAEDYAKASKWYEKAADAGDHRGLNKVLNHYESGWHDRIIEDWNSTAHVVWYQQAVDAGSADAAQALSRLHSEPFV